MEDFQLCQQKVNFTEFLFVSVIAFADGYQRERFSKRTSNAIYVTLGNCTFNY